jgi:tetratricopeptide (TPR) repeat protein
MAASLKASKHGLEIVDRSRQRKGWKRQDEAWLQVASVTLGVLKRFWRRFPIQADSFIKLCQAVDLDNWQDIAELDDRSTSSYPLDNLATPASAVPVELSAQSSQQARNSDSTVLVSQVMQMANNSEMDLRNSLRQKPNNNLPHFPYKVLGREEELNQLLKHLSLSYRMPFIIVDGIGGVGKTSLVLEAAFRCWEAKHNRSESNIPLFDAIIFTTAKENKLEFPGILNKLQSRRRLQKTLDDIFYIISLTLNHPEIFEGKEEDKIEKVYEILKQQSTLLIVDNMETMTDEAQDKVISFLSDLPHTTKAAITTRRRRWMSNGIHLSELSQDQSIELIQRQAVDKGIEISREQSEKLYERIHGIPIALIYTIGQIAGGHSIDVVIDRKTPLPDNITRFCFDSSLELFREEHSRKLLMSLAIFHDAPRRETIIEVAGLKTEPMYIVDDAFAELYQFSLVTRNDNRYSMISLTREYALAELAKEQNFEKDARERWIKWYIDLAKEHGGLDWGDWVAQYQPLEEEWGNLQAVFNWCIDEERYQNVRELYSYLTDFTRIKCHWNELLDWTTWLIEKSQQQKDPKTTVEALLQQGWILSLKGKIEKSEIEKGEALLKRAWEQRLDVNINEQCAIAERIAYVYSVKNDNELAHSWLDKAESLWENIKDKDKESKKIISRIYLTLRSHRARIYAALSEYEQAKSIFREMIDLAEKINLLRFVIETKRELGEIAKAQREFNYAEELFKEAISKLETIGDYHFTFRCYKSYANLEEERGNLEKANELNKKYKLNWQRACGKS